MTTLTLGEATALALGRMHAGTSGLRRRPLHVAAPRIAPARPSAATASRQEPSKSSSSPYPPKARPIACCAWRAPRSTPGDA
ncbi:hypothetical protein ACFSHP_20575 [Novosphingobium panipatense]